MKNQLRFIIQSFHRNAQQQAHIGIGQLLSKYPDNPELMQELAVITFSFGINKLALQFIKASFELEKTVDRLVMLADLNFKLGNYSDAAIQFEESTKHLDDKNMYLRAANAYEKLDYYDQSISILKKGYKKYKDENILLYLINTYILYGNIEEAKKSVKKFEKEFPNSKGKYSMLAFFNEVVLNDYEKAKEYYLKAAKSGDINAYYNIGSCCKNNEDYDEAEKYLKKLATFKNRDIIDYNYTLGSIYMAQRKLRQGYKYYEKRDIAQNINTSKIHWDGKEYPNETLCIFREQGFGDNIQFIRYLPLAAKKFKKLIYVADSILVDLFRRSLPARKYPNIKIVSDIEGEKYDKIALIMDLPYLLNMTYYNIPAKKSYLVPDKEKVKYFKEKYFNTDKLKIGLNWRSKGMGIRDAMYRTIDAPYYLKDLFDIPNVQYYSLQFGDIFDMTAKFPQMIDLIDEIKTFDDSAAIIKNLDMVITVDSAITHLAGGLGIKTYLMLCKGPDWRWFNNHDSTEWYPSIKIFRQKDRRSWDDVSKKLIETVKKDAKKLKS